MSLYVSLAMVSTRKGRQQNRRLFSQLDEFDDDFLIRRDSHNTLAESRASVTSENVALNNRAHRALANGSPVNMQTLERDALLIENLAK